MGVCTDPLGDAITVLENAKIEDRSARTDTEDAANRIDLALEYLRMLGTHRAQALVHGIRDRTTHPYALEMLDELERIVSP